MTTELWVEKYRPQQLKDIVGQKANLDVVKQWLEDFQNRRIGIKRALLFSGPPGLGKTTLAHCLLNEYGYRVREYNASDIRSQKLIESNLHELIKTDDVDKIFGKPVKPTGVIMDEVDGMMSGDRGGLAALVKVISPFKGQRNRTAMEKSEKVWGSPIICICNSLDQKIKDLRKECLEITFKRPLPHELNSLLTRICQAEKLNLSESARKLVLEHIAQGDFRRLVFFLQYLYQLYGPEVEIDRVQVEQGQVIFAQKEQDLNMTESVNQLLNQKLPAFKVMRIYDNDKSLLPLMIHENAPQGLNLQRDQVSPAGRCYLASQSKTTGQGKPSNQAFEKLNRLQQTLRAIITGDLIDKAMYTHQCWYLQPVHGLFSCLIPTYHINQVQKMSYIHSKFTTALSSYSIACTNHKTITQIKSLVSTRWAFSTEQVHHFSRLVNHYLWHNQIEKAVRLIRYYGLTVTDKDSDLDRLIRVDRFRDKSEIPVRIKNQLLNQEKALAAVDTRRSKIVFLKDSKFQQAQQSRIKFVNRPKSDKSRTKSENTVVDKPPDVDKSRTFSENTAVDKAPMSVSVKTPKVKISGSTFLTKSGLTCRIRAPIKIKEVHDTLVNTEAPEAPKPLESQPVELKPKIKIAKPIIKFKLKN